MPIKFSKLKMGIFKLAAYSIGGYQILTPFWHFYVHYYNQFYFRKNENFAATNKGRWAIVTGSSDGIGKEFVKELG
jgi:hypothetical protein